MDNKTGWAVGLGIVLLLVLGFFWFRSSKAPQVNTPADQTASTTAPQVVKESQPQATITQVLANIPEASQFSSYLSSTGVGASLSSTGKYTIFVPTNGAFSLLAPNVISSMTAAQRKQWVQYHIVSGKKLDIDAVNSGRITALSKDTLNFLVSDGGASAQVNSAYVIKSYETKNGIIYLINGVLIPPEKAAY